MRKLRNICVILFLLGLLGCGKTAVKGSQGWDGYKQRGKASYYAMKYQNQKTASGERLNQRSNTAAHRQLPFGTNVKVTNLKNGKSVIVKINDRGPFVKGRIIDFTRSAFSRIGDLNAGIISVEIQVIK